MDRAKSIALLNTAVADELQAVHQYMYFHFVLDDMDLKPLAMLFKRTAIEEMIHIERLAERILFLKGDVELVAAGPVEKIHEPIDMLKKAMAMEDGSQESYNDSAKACAENRDSASKQLFESLVVDEERHFDQYELEKEKVEKLGPNYMALQAFLGSGGAGSAMPPAGGGAPA
ncbi:ferritin-like domain-containing protein [Holophaga foetida]|uniref:ferritin-like domain-containing protein n=1 Tax=Holophaga foetida TaxID=35839 RepID=UPI000247217D|nr:ferritin-like domain-containing protein [Holophaga foetida]